MQKDIRDTPLYREAEQLYTALLRPGSGQIGDAAEINASPDGQSVVLAGTIADSLDGMPPTRICQVNLASGDTRVLTFGPNVDRLPKYSPDGQRIAFLSDRRKLGDFQLYLLDPTTGAARPTPTVGGWVEYFHWSPDGQRILLGVAGHGADVAGGQGAVASKQEGDAAPSWMPLVETGDESFRWRRAWIYEIASDRVYQASADGDNIWEAVWCGNDQIAAVISLGSGEGLWYDAGLHLINADSGKNRELYAPIDQLGWPAASPSGKHVAVVEAICSDRWIVAGDLRLIDTADGQVARIDTNGIDVTYTEWRSDNVLLLAGHRGFETAVGVYDVETGTFKETWASADITTGGRYVSVSGIGANGDCALLGESFVRAPEVATLRAGNYQPTRSFAPEEVEAFSAVSSVDQVRWQAPDGLEILGWLLKPQRECSASGNDSGVAPCPAIMNVHGGPVFHWRPNYLGRRGAFQLMLLERGYAMFFPNPRGSSGRGQDFAGRVKGDMNGADTQDLLSGLDHLVTQRVIDAQRIGVTGGSYGGNMTAWLITQDTRFYAAVPVAPHTNQVTEHLISNIPHFVTLFLNDHYSNPNGRYFERSPVMHAHNIKTPTLNICGALDRCTPPEEAVQFHNALLENTVESVLVTYPEEGHGVRKFPAAIDCAARITEWFLRHPSTQISIENGQKSNEPRV